ncbi:TPA: tropomodulin 3 (ubiquitous)-like [Bos taurus]|nr:TPA: tropomodulin 3 (ubiquitous)-like [Bos taurus]
MALSFRKDLEKYKDLDEDELLGNLSEVELKQLETVLDDLDPENALLPAGFRQKNQTSKSATGPFDREHLLSYLEKEALEHKDREDYVPYTGEKKESGLLSPVDWATEISHTDAGIPFADWSLDLLNDFTHYSFGVRS